MKCDYTAVLQFIRDLLEIDESLSLKEAEHEICKVCVQGIDLCDFSTLIDLGELDGSVNPDIESSFLCSIAMPESGPGIPWSLVYHLHHFKSDGCFVVTELNTYPSEDEDNQLNLITLFRATSCVEKIEVAKNSLRARLAELSDELGFHEAINLYPMQAGLIKAL